MLNVLKEDCMFKKKYFWVVNFYYRLTSPVDFLRLLLLLFSKGAISLSRSLGRLRSAIFSPQGAWKQQFNSTRDTILLLTVFAVRYPETIPFTYLGSILPEVCPWPIPLLSNPGPSSTAFAGLKLLIFLPLTKFRNAVLQLTIEKSNYREAANF